MDKVNDRPFSEYEYELYMKPGYRNGEEDLAGFS